MSRPHEIMDDHRVIPELDDRTYHIAESSYRRGVQQAFAMLIRAIEHNGKAKVLAALDSIEELAGEMRYSEEDWDCYLHRLMGEAGLYKEDKTQEMP